jgi:hypothetical protein
MTSNFILFVYFKKRVYENTKVKCEGQISRGFEEKQGGRQGGVWSPTA